MSFALEKSKLWDHVLSLAVALSALTAKPNNTEKRSKKVYQQFFQIKNFTDNVQHTMVKIGRICTKTVQIKFLSQKDLAS